MTITIHRQLYSTSTDLADFNTEKIGTQNQLGQ